MLRASALLLVVLLVGCAGQGPSSVAGAPEGGTGTTPVALGADPAADWEGSGSGDGAAPDARVRHTVVVPANASELVLDVPWGGAVAHARIYVEGGFPWISFQPYEQPDGDPRTDVLGYGLVAVQAGDACPRPARAYAVRWTSGGDAWSFDSMTEHVQTPMHGGTLDLLVWREASYQGRPVELGGPMRFLLDGDGEEVPVPVSVVTTSPVRFASSAWSHTGEHSMPWDAALALATASFQVPWLAVGAWEATLAAASAGTVCDGTQLRDEWSVTAGRRGGRLDLGAVPDLTSLTASLSHAPAAARLPLLDPEQLVAVRAIGLDVDLPSA